MGLNKRNRKDFHIEVLSSSSKIIEDNFNRNIDILKQELPFVNVSSRVYSKGYLGYLAGTREERAKEFISALKRLISFGGGGVVFSRGGYGSIHILPYISEFLRSLNNQDRVKLSNIFLFGYSDVTTLMWYLSSFGIKSFYTQNLSSEDFSVSLKLLKQLGFDNKIYLNDLKFEVFNLETNTSLELSLSDTENYKLDKVNAPMLGGTMSVISSIAGSDFFKIRHDKIILFLEDVNEPTYKIDRYLSQLEFAGLFNKVEAIVLGSFDDCGEYKKVFLDFSNRLRIPLYELKDKIGHGGFTRWLFIG